MGENAITVSYAGAVDGNYRALPSQANETVTVNPIAVKMQYDTIQQTAAYTGLKQSCFVSTVNVVRTDNGKTVDSQVKPEVFYRQDGKMLFRCSRAVMMSGLKWMETSTM